MPDFHELAGEWARSVGGWLVVGSLSGWDEEMVLFGVSGAVVVDFRNFGVSVLVLGSAGFLVRRVDVGMHLQADSLLVEIDEVEDFELVHQRLGV